MSGFSGKLVWKIFFDDLHFTNSPNVFPFIVWSSRDTNKIKTHISSKTFVTFLFYFIVGHIDFNSPLVLPFSTWYSTKLSTQD
jgi:hypothetical protein